MNEVRIIHCSVCGEYLGTLKGNKLNTKNECGTTGRTIGRYSEAYIKCKCGIKEEFIY